MSEDETNKNDDEIARAMLRGVAPKKPEPKPYVGRGYKNYGRSSYDDPYRSYEPYAPHAPRYPSRSVEYNSDGYWSVDGEWIEDGGGAPRSTPPLSTTDRTRHQPSRGQYPLGSGHSQVPRINVVALKEKHPALREVMALDIDYDYIVAKMYNAMIDALDRHDWTVKGGQEALELKMIASHQLGNSLGQLLADIIEQDLMRLLPTLRR